MREKTKKPWPTKAVMNQIYDLNLWGGQRGEFSFLVMVPMTLVSQNPI
ncbi:hypothetical protein [Tamlana fucoidanivorans]